MEKIKKLWRNIGVQFVEFGLVGVSNTIVSLITYYCLVFFGVYYLVANFAGFITGTLNAYYWNSRFVFKKEAESQRGSRKPIVKTFFSYGFTFVLTTFTMYLQVKIIGVSEMIAPIINVMISTPINYLLNKFWTFAKRGES